jgi:hypothetical protein
MSPARQGAAVGSCHFRGPKANLTRVACAIEADRAGSPVSWSRVGEEFECRSSRSLRRGYTIRSALGP